MLHIQLCKIFILYLHRYFEVQANVLTLGNSKWDAMPGSWEEGSMKQGKCRASGKILLVALKSPAPSVIMCKDVRALGSPLQKAK